MNDKVRSLTDVQKGELINIEMSANFTYFQSTDSFRLAWQMASKLCKSQLVPKRFQGTDDGVIMDCLLALDMAHRTRTNPLMVLQNLYVVHGTPAWSGQFVIAMINQSGKFSEPLHFEFVGERGSDSWGCYATTTTKSGKVIKGPTVTIGTAKAEGWYKQNPKWTSIPDLMLRYRAGSWFGRTECPELMMGISTKEEIVDAPMEFIDSETGEIVTTQTLKAAKIKEAAPAEKVVDMSADVKVKTGHLQSAKQTTATPKTEEKTEEKTDEKTEEKTEEVAVDDMDYDDQLQYRGYYLDRVKKTYFNIHGVEWDPNLHATSKETNGPVINSDGNYRARRGAADADEVATPAPKKTQVPDKDPGPDDDDVDMGEWE